MASSTFALISVVFGAAWGAWRVPAHWMTGRPLFWLRLACVLSWLPLIPGVSKQSDGACRWISIPWVMDIPVWHFVVLAYLFAMVSLSEQPRHGFKVGWEVVGLSVLTVWGFIAQPHAWPILLIVLLAMLTLLLNGRWRWVACSFLPLFIALAWLVFRIKYVKIVFIRYFFADRSMPDPLVWDYQLLRNLELINSSHWLGAADVVRQGALHVQMEGHAPMYGDMALFAGYFGLLPALLLLLAISGVVAWALWCVRTHGERRVRILVWLLSGVFVFWAAYAVLWPLGRVPLSNVPFPLGHSLYASGVGAFYLSLLLRFSRVGVGKSEPNVER